MDRNTQRSHQRSTAQQPQAQPQAAAQQETFSQMADVTASKSGIAGKLLIVSLILASIAVTIFIGLAIRNGVGTSESLVDANKYQAVFLADGQIYFGKLTNVDNRYAELTDIYYLQVEQQQAEAPIEGQEPVAPQSRVSLAKLGDELHGPEDRMLINTDQILFWENLKDDGRVVEAITEFVNNGGNNEGEGEEN